MPTKVESMPRAGNSKYDWDQLLDGNAWRLEPHEVSNERSLRVTACRQAKAQQKKATVRVVTEKGERVFYIQATAIE